MATTTTAELLDSGNLAGDGKALRHRIASDGYVFVRGLLDAGQVRAVGTTGLGYLQDAGWMAPGGDPVLATPLRPIRAVRMRDAFGDPGYRRIIADPGFNAIPFTSPLADLMAQILGPHGLLLPPQDPPGRVPEPMVPRQPGNFVHKDYGSVQDMFTCWVPLGDVPHALGGLAVLPGSQHTSQVSHYPLSRLEPGWLTTDYRAGDVLVFHCLTTHAALPNREGRMRFSGEFRWQLADQPAPRRMVIGPNGREIGSLMFRRTPWWRSVARGLVLTDAGGVDEGAVLPAVPSRFVTFEN